MYHCLLTELVSIWIYLNEIDDILYLNILFYIGIMYLQEFYFILYP